MYSEDELLMLSGIQHIAFCERQWALIHIEQHWSENLFTVEGHYLHQRTDDPFEDEARGNIITWRALPLISYNLGLTGRADVVELLRTKDSDSDSISISEKPGRWKLVPVEYKRGKPKTGDCDEIQLCAQTICLEEMYEINIQEGYLYYGTTRHRYKVGFTSCLKDQVFSLAKRMHSIYESGITPAADYQPHCRSCSISDFCLPRTMGNRLSGTEYLKQNLLM